MNANEAFSPSMETFFLGSKSLCDPLPPLLQKLRMIDDCRPYRLVNLRIIIFLSFCTCVDDVIDNKQEDEESIRWLAQSVFPFLT